MARKKKVEFYEAKTGFVTMFNDEQIGVAAGELVRAGHPLLDGREDLFRPWEGPRFDVEQATAEPGEKRGEKK
jgi:hypothetical protein